MVGGGSNAGIMPNVNLIVTSTCKLTIELKMLSASGHCNKNSESCEDVYEVEEVVT